MNNKIKLHGFNNLTKSMSFNFYHVAYTRDHAAAEKYIKEQNKVYNAKYLANILQNVSNIIGAEILNLSCQDYEPHGASVTMLVSEEPVNNNVTSQSNSNAQNIINPIVAHLDKSHITVHTYPESHPATNVCTFRIDIDVSTCGVISPLRALNLLFNQIDADIIHIDYRIRGYTRQEDGKKIYIDHKIDSICDYLPPSIMHNFQIIDNNIAELNLFNSNLLRKNFNLSDYFFGENYNTLTENEKNIAKHKLQQEILEIFHSVSYSE